MRYRIVRRGDFYFIQHKSFLFWHDVKHVAEMTSEFRLFMENEIRKFEDKP